MTAQDVHMARSFSDNLSSLLKGDDVYAAPHAGSDGAAKYTCRIAALNCPLAKSGARVAASSCSQTSVSF